MIVVAGMEGALFSVVAGLVGGVVIAVPTSIGYGAARQGETALHAALASCAPGLVTVNIDNGYGAASAALRTLGVPARPPAVEPAARCPTTATEPLTAIRASLTRRAPSATLARL